MKSTILKNKLAICILFIPYYSICQVSTPLNTFFNPNDYIGWNSTAGSPPLNIKTELAQPINFYTFAGNGTFNNLRMTIYDDPSLPFNAGFVGIGISTPNFRLTVQDDINLIPGGFPDFGYRWEGYVILKTNFVIDNIFLGSMAGFNAGAGTANTFLGAFAGRMHSGNSGGNTFVGWNAGSGGNNVGESVFVGSRAGEFNNGNNNSFVGVLSGNGTALNGSSENSFFGNYSGYRNTGSKNTFLGNYTGQLNESNLNTFVGYRSGQNNLGGRNNVFTGANTGNSNTIGSNLAFFGYESGFSNIDGANNSFGGSFSGWNNLSGSDNSFYGFESGFTNSRGNENVFTGSKTGYNNQDGSYNTFAGFEAGFSNIADNDNTYYGYFSGRNLSAGIKNTFIGSQAGTATTDGSEITLIGAGTTADNSLTNATAIGSSAHVTGSNQMILGNNDVKVGIGLSGNTSGPQNNLEINANIPNSSGLRFRQLNLGSTFTPGVSKFLTVNGAGDVILGEIPGSGGSINACSAGLTDIDFITKISGDNEICRTVGIYESPIVPNTVGIGVGSLVNSGPYNNFKLDVKGDLYIRHDISNGIGGDIWMPDHFNIRRPVLTMYGLNGFGVIAVGPNSGSNSQFTSTLANNNVYVGLNTGMLTANTRNNTFIGYSTGVNYTGTSSEGYNTLVGSNVGNALTGGDFNTFVGDNSGGVTSGSDNVMLGQTTYISNAAIGVSMTGDRNIILGAKAHLMGPVGITNITNSVSIGYSNRVIASNFIGMGFQVNPGIGEQQIGMGYQAPPTPAPPILAGNLAKLYVNTYMGGIASAFFNGNAYAAGMFVPSDSALKDNITAFTDAYTIINQLEAKSYEFKHASYPGLNLPTGNQIGFIAEDIQAVLPGLIHTVSSPAIYDSMGVVLHPQVNFDAVNYTGLIPVLFTAIKQQQELLDSLLIVISTCCSSPVFDPSQSNRVSISLSNNEAIVLNQNTPNPFKDKTEISYYIPESVQSALIMFYDQNGKIIQQHKISHKGSGSLTVYSEDLTSGIYTYTLLIDDKSYETKRMVKQ